MEKILITDSSQTNVDLLVSKLENGQPVLGLTDPDAILDAVRSFAPDRILLDLDLPGLDWQEVLRRAFQLGKPCHILVTTVYANSYICNVLQEYGVSSIAVKPYLLRSLAERLMSVENTRIVVANLRSLADQILLELGLRQELSGYRYLLEAVLYQYAYPESMVMKDTFPAVAQILGGTHTQVERAIRTCIQDGWKTRNSQLWAQIFPAEVKEPKQKMTNRIFLAGVCKFLEEQM